MKKLFMLFCFIMLSLATVVSAQEQGRPDPTGKGRYMQFGHESPYENARVAKELPSGTECASAGELIGVKIWNSTREGKAILSELTDKALVAVTSDGQIFLCECAGGFNQLFLIKSTSPSVSSPVQQVTSQAPEPQPVELNVNITNNIPAPTPQMVEEKEHLPPIFDANVPTGTGNQPRRSFVRRHWKGITGLALLGGAIAYGIENCWFY